MIFPRMAGNAQTFQSQMPRGHQEVPLQRRRSTTRAPQTKHGVVHRNHRKSTQQTRRRRARGRRETRHDLGLIPNEKFDTNPKLLV